MLNKIARRRHLRSVRLANVVRSDDSYNELNRFKQDGYSRAIFVRSTDADEICRLRDGKIWEIDDLLAMWNTSEPYIIFWLTHPNCLCHFSPDPASKAKPEEPAQLIQKPEVPPMTMQPAPTQPKMV